MPCAVVLIALIFPRLALLLVWIFSDFLGRAFQSVLWPILGFVFLPTSLLWFTAVQRWFGGEWTLWPIVGLVIALMIDVSPASGRRKRKE